MLNVEEIKGMNQEEFEKAYQEDVNASMKDRLARKESDIRKEYDGFVSPDKFKELTDSHKKEIDNFNAKYKDIEEKCKGYKSKIEEYESNSVKASFTLEKTNLAYQNGLPFEFVDRLKGTNKEEVLKDIENLKNFINTSPKYPSRNLDHSKDDEKEPFRNLLNSMKGD